MQDKKPNKSMPSNDIAARYKEEMMKQYKQARQTTPQTQTQPQLQPQIQPQPQPQPVPREIIPIPVEIQPEQQIKPIPAPPVILPEMVKPPMPEIPITGGVIAQKPVTPPQNKPSVTAEPELIMPVEPLPTPELTPDIPIKECKFPPIEELIKNEICAPKTEVMPECEKSGTKIFDVMDMRDNPQDIPKIINEAKRNTLMTQAEEHHQGNYDFQPAPDNDEAVPVFASSTTQGAADEPNNNMEKGFLEVEATTADNAIPIQDATIIVTKKTDKGDILIGMLVTDESGDTRIIPLEAPPESISKDPETKELPYSLYRIDAYSNKFYPVTDIDVPIFPTIKSIQPITFVPLAKGETFTIHDNGHM